ncbi:cation:proton antiporter [Ihubacter massiliensis]|uniref:cation:proton antiporter domain-containing protein n=1 Tax=Ihubacter massiliensis TaxID=1852367 RepID=UPI001D111BB2|nr:cation:proton antiporter [Ihubacter massiliensis]MCC2865502.1 cation:proton antiporter [Anaerovorax odorimutans]MCI7302590.1 cation:proton antiporter [Clostridia bacterium]MDE8732598.1 cation:proton antiporter [Eubacteriales bacterium DFI.9.88]MDY3010057.1 cation:proton antiporter [Clostridiales Family XIII bacterium]MCO7121202.1 cation:proton antiporter [Ihubacter massiliensis]
MEQLDYLISDLALILVVAGIMTLIFKKLKQPVVLAYIIAGFLISPNFRYLPTVVDVEDIHVWANIGIVFLMFGLGLEFSFKKIATVGGSAFVTAMTVMMAMILIGYTAGQLLGWAKMDSVFLGGMLSMSSTMIILKAYEEYKLKKEKFAQLVLGTLVLEDIGGIFMMIILSTVAVGQSTSGLGLFKDIGMLILCLMIWLVLGIYLIPTFLKKVSDHISDELLLIISIALCLGMVVIANLIGFSSALGAFLAGSILAGTLQAKRIEKLVKPIKDLFGAVFFVSVGMMIEPQLLIEYLGPILIITVVTILGQMTFATLGILFSGQSLHTAIRGGFSMVQIGEFSFIVATLGMNLGVTSDFLYPIVVCVSVITTFTTPIFIKHSEKVYDFAKHHLSPKLYKFLNRHTSEQQSTADKDWDWQRYIIKFFIRSSICTAGIFVVYIGGTRFLQGFVQQYIQGLAANILTAVVTCIFMIPLISIMCSKKSVLYTKLWLKNQANRMPLLAFTGVRIIISCGFIVMTLRVLLRLPYILLAVLSFAVIVFIIKSDYIKGKTLKMEMRFVENFYETTLVRQKKERGIKGEYHWLDESFYVVEFKVTQTIKQNTILEFCQSRFFHVTIIKIIRDGKHFNMPNGKFRVIEGDIIHAIGTKNEIESCILMLEKADHIQEPQEPMVTLREYIYGQIFYEIEPEKQIICCPIQVEKDSILIKKSIKNSGFRPKYKGYILGIERGMLPIVNPDIDMVIEEGDLLWVIGTQKMANSLLKADFLDEEE